MPQAVDIRCRERAPDCLWPSDNSLDIPLLDDEMQAGVLDLPVNIWGSRGRTKLTRQSATLLFYTDDYRFEALWRRPEAVVSGSVINAGEANFSVYQTMPLAQAIFQVYRKRWLARYWQRCGVRIFVDMNVAP